MVFPYVNPYTSTYARVRWREKFFYSYYEYEKIKKNKRFSAVFEYIAIPAHSGYSLYLKREWVNVTNLQK